MDLMKLILEAVIGLAGLVAATAASYLALNFRAFRAEMLLEIKNAVAALSAVYMTRAECALRHELVDVKLEREKES